MTEEILVNVTPRETRVAVVENGMLQELHIERGWRRGVVGNIYKGKVQRVMPGMQAAFVEIGLDRAAFLHANDIFKPSPVPSDEGDDVALPPIGSFTTCTTTSWPSRSSSVISGTAVATGGAGVSSPATRSGAGRRMSLACRNAARSRPISTNAACMPGITRCTLPL